MSLHETKCSIMTKATVVAASPKSFIVPLNVSPRILYFPYSPTTSLLSNLQGIFQSPWNYKE